MNKQQFFSVAIKILGLLLLINCVENIANFFILLTANKENFCVSYYLLPPTGNIIHFTMILFYGITGYFFLTRSGNISGRFLDGRSVVLTKEVILEIIFLYIGLEMIVFALPPIIRFPFHFITTSDSFGIQIMQNNSPAQTSLLILNIVKIIVGVILMRHSAKIAKFLASKIPEKFWTK
jgi:hypothetical protein